MAIIVKRVPVEERNEDLQIVARLEASLNREIFSDKCWLSNEVRVIDWLFKEKNYGRPKLVLLAEESKSPKGHVIYSIWNNVCSVSSLYVVKDCRGIGIGSQLLDCAAKDAKSRAASDVYLLPVEGSIDFYKHKGFKKRVGQSTNGLFLPIP